MKKLHYPGEKIGFLTLLDKEKVTLPGGKTLNKWRCICDCGKETYVFASNLGQTLSCGHLIKENVLKTVFKDLSGQRFDKLLVLHRSPDRIRKNGNHVVQYECLCDCGKTKCVDAAELRKGVVKSCGCNAINSMKKKLTKDLCGQSFGKLTVIKQLESVKYGKHSSTMTKWLCKCECGATTEVFGCALRKGQISCGCINSKGEEIVASYLTQKNLLFQKQYSFVDLVSPHGNQLYFDFAVWINDKLTLLEYQGIQHYIPQPNHFGDYQRNVTDILKKEYCQQHNIPLFEIRYDEDVKNKIDELYDNPVPSSEKKRCNDYSERK